MRRTSGQPLLGVVACLHVMRRRREARRDEGMQDGKDEDQRRDRVERVCADALQQDVEQGLPIRRWVGGEAARKIRHGVMHGLVNYR